MVTMLPSGEVESTAIIGTDPYNCIEEGNYHQENHAPYGVGFVVWKTYTQ